MNSLSRICLLSALTVAGVFALTSSAVSGQPKSPVLTAFGKAPAFVQSLSSQAASRKTKPPTASPYTVIISGLHAPRGLAFGPGDRLFVAEAGLGGTTSHPINFNGAIDEILNAQTAHATLRPVVSGIASLSAGEDILGLGGLSVHGNGNIYAIMGSLRTRSAIPRSDSFSR